ncbi:hypothetical protein HK104_007110 [Borealophlyctis nickersoniae]|nr:hypothetical protein HK104_007110 [Borealophlyctis nickersoniae]
MPATRSKPPPPPVPAKPPTLAARKIRQRARLSTATFSNLTPTIRSRASQAGDYFALPASRPMSTMLDRVERGSPGGKTDGDRAFVRYTMDCSGNIGHTYEDQQRMRSILSGLRGENAELMQTPIIADDSVLGTPLPGAPGPADPPVDTCLPPESHTDPLSPAPSDETIRPPSNASTTPRTLSRSGSWRFRLSRHSMADSVEMTAEEAILSNVFTGALRFEVAESLLEGEDVEVVPVYSAVALFDFQADPEIPQTVSITAGEKLVVYGSKNVRNTVLGNRDSSVDEWDFLKEVEVSNGWAQVELADGTVGFAPVSYLQLAGAPSSPMSPAEYPEFELALAETPAQTSSSPSSSNSSPNSIGKASQHQYESLGVPPDAERFNAYVASIREPSIAPSLHDSPAYPSAVISLTSATSLVANKVQKGLQRVWKSWFSGNSVQDFIVKGTGEEGSSTTSRKTPFDSDDEDERPRHRRFSSGATGGLQWYDKHWIVNKGGPSWQGRNPPFFVTVRNPERRRKVSTDASFAGATNTIIDDFVSYKVTTWFPDEKSDSPSTPRSANSTHTTITVDRRFTDFEWLHERLSIRFPPPVVVLPSLPKKHLTKRFDAAQVEVRRRGLESYLKCIGRHPLLRSEEVVMLFLSCGGATETGVPAREVGLSTKAGVELLLEPAIVVEDEEWLKGMKQYDTERPSNKATGPAQFFGRVQHTESIPSESGMWEVMERFSEHLALIEGRLEPLLDASQKHQSLSSSLSKQYEGMSRALEALARGKDDDGRLAQCHEFSASMLGISKQMQGIAEVYDSHGETDLALFNESARHYQQLLAGYQDLIQLHHIAAMRYDDVISRHSHDPSTTALKNRLSVVVNATGAEVGRLHDEKTWGWRAWIIDWLDGMISAQEKVLQHLKAARETLESSE